jgi:Dyp-type peroxidase family
MIGLLQNLPFLKRQPTLPTVPPSLELSDIQGLIISAYPHLQAMRYCFLAIQDPVKACQWLQALLDEGLISHGQWDLSVKPTQAINLAVTATGLAQLQAPPELLKSFSQEFHDGMDEPNRARQLGDLGRNAPEHWDSCWRGQQVHVLLILQASPDAIEALVSEHQQRIQANGGLQLIAQEVGELPEDGREHFGFRDGISQPILEGSPQYEKLSVQDKQGLNVIKAGEFVLGYPNEDGNLPQTPTLAFQRDPHNHLVALDRMHRDFGRNGSYLVFRKLEQDVAAFHQYFQDQFDESSRDKMKAKVVGRWPSGLSLAESPDYDRGPELEAALAAAQSSPQQDINPQLVAALNAFKYRQQDPQGFRCPFGAHVRRVNPRDSFGDSAADEKAVRRRRILRRGANYGTRWKSGDPAEIAQQARGVLFFCLNANIRRQFEFVQQGWVNNPKFHGLYDERDPLIGNNPEDQPRRMVIPGKPMAQEISLPNFVTLKGGAYFFVPSLSALRCMASWGNS